MKYVLITGATGTIGKAICEILIKKQFTIIAHGRNPQKLKALKEHLEKTYSSQVITVQFDLRTKSSILSGLEILMKTHKLNIDVLINNASETPKKKILTEEGLECQFAVNILGYHRMIQYLQKYMPPGSRIINVA
ncbi:MAG: SDR family oxidoreductase, partial [Leptospiraceae bacterium]|nr:SDR family oxidoreductase [Leptospiraceae bacterium]MDW7975950.1 SDR family oxidoreductase [Leptospiraceae bacterium]